MMLNPDVKTYLFDFDGTLVDSMPTFVGAMLRILDEHGIAYGEDLVKIITPLGLLGTANYFINELGLQRTQEQLIGRMKDYMLEAYRHTIPAKAHVAEVLKELKKRGIRLNILTASPHITLDACLKRLGLFDLFDHVWSCDDFQTTKADPAIYQMAAKKMQMPVEKVLFFDDNIGANTTAKAAGMQTCGVYDPSSADYVEELKAATDYYIHDFLELLEI